MNKSKIGRDPEYDRYLYIIENMKDVIWEMDAAFVYTYMSPNAKQMCGYASEEMVGRSMPEFLTEESRNYVVALAGRHLNSRIEGSRDKIMLQVVQFVCKDGLIKWVEVAVQPKFDEKGFSGYIGTTRDITEKKTYEIKLGQYIEELKVSNEKLEQTAAVDSLTGAYNRRRFDDDLSLIIKKREKNGSTFSLVFMDVDHFKNINDQYGHKKGDLVLQRISELIKKNIRSTDSLFRWGGDEFIVILPDAKLENAEKIAEKLRKNIASHNFGIGQNITFSIGVGEYHSEEDTDQVLMRLDEALFAAKSGGRNCVVAC